MDRPSTSTNNNLNSKKQSVRIFVFLWEIILVAAVLFLFLVMFLYLAPHLALALMPYILLILLVLRLFQFISHSGDTYKNVTQFKHFVRICLFTALLTFQCSIHLNLVSYQHQDRFPFDLHKLALHQSKKKHILIRYMFSFVAYFVIHDFGTKQSYDGSNLHIMQALTEIIDCFTLFWEDNIMSSIECSSPHILLEDRPIEIKYVLAALLKYSDLMRILAPVLMYYDLFILFIEFVRYVLRKLFYLFMKPSPSPRYRATSKIEVIYTLIAKRSFSFFFSFLLVYKVCSDCLASFFSYKFAQAKLLPSEEYDKISVRFETFKELEDSTYNILFSFFILWIIKTYVLLACESRTIYDRLRTRILSVSKQLYFLGILDHRDQNIFNVQHIIKTEEGTNIKVRSLREQVIQLMIQASNVFVDIIQTSSLMSLRGVEGSNGWRKIKRNKIKDDLLWHKPCDPSLYDIQHMAQYIVGAKNNIQDNYISAVLTLVDPNGNKRNIRRSLENLIAWQNEYKEDGDYFVQELLKINDDVESGYSWAVFSFIKSQDKPKKTKEISFIDFRTWVIKAHDNVKSLSNTLSSAKEVTEGLNKLVSTFLTGATFMAWLKALKYAETSKDFALIASPFFAATFLIKDTLKDLFERIFFVYVIHPFDIGDILLIDNKMMEVAAMGLWTTTFLALNKDGRRERREAIIYPNSMLAKTKIIKHNMEFDFGDDAENEQVSSSKCKNIKKND